MSRRRPAPSHRRRERRLTHPGHLRGEPLEPRVVLTAAPAVLTAAQRDALIHGFDVLAQRLADVQSTGLLATEMVATGETLAALVPVGDTFRTAVAAPFRTTVAGITNVATIASKLDAVLDADPDRYTVGNGSVTSAAVLESVGGREVLWFDIDLSRTRTLPDFTLDVTGIATVEPGAGSSSAAPPAGSPAARGLSLGELRVPLQAGLAGHVRLGVDVSAANSADPWIFIKIDQFVASATVSTTVRGVEGEYGILELGPADVAVSLAVKANIDLIEPAGVMSLGELNAGAAGSLFTIATTAGESLDVAIPFAFGVSGFVMADGKTSATGTTQTLHLVAKDNAVFNPASLDFQFPSLKLAGAAAAFDFSSFATISTTDLGSYLDELKRLVPSLGAGSDSRGAFSLPVIDQRLDEVYDLAGTIGGFIDGLRDDAGAWKFGSVQDLLMLALETGKTRGVIAANATLADFGLAWNGAAQALEFTLPLSLGGTATTSFDASKIVPAGLPLSVSGAGTGDVTLASTLRIAGGVSVPNASYLPDVSIKESTLLSALNGGNGLTTRSLIQRPGADGEDIRFKLADGSTIGFDLDTLKLGNGVAAGTATVGNLITLLESTGRLDVSLEQNRLVVAAATGKSAPVAVLSPSYTETIESPVARADGTKSSTTNVITSFAPLVLGLTAPPAADGRIEGGSLAGSTVRDRIYVRSDSDLSAAIQLKLSLEAGASLGPMALTVPENQGKLIGGAALKISLADPSNADGRITLSDMDGGASSLVTYSYSGTPTLDGIFQLKAPAALESTLALNAGDYRDLSYTLDLTTNAPVLGGVPDRPTTDLVPYVTVTASKAGGWAADVAPSEKLKSGLASLAGLSATDIPAMLRLLSTRLEGLPFWNTSLPLAGFSLGDLLAFGDLIGKMPTIDLTGLLGDPSITIGDNVTSGGTGFAIPEFSFAGFHLPLPASFGLLDLDFNLLFDRAAGEASVALDDGLFLRWQRLAWDLDKLKMQWAGRLPDVDGFDLDFLDRLRGWASSGRLVFGDLPAMPGLPLYDNLRIGFGKLIDGIDGFDLFKGISGFEGSPGFAFSGGLEDFGPLLKLIFPGLGLGDVTTSFQTIGATKAFVFDLTFTLPSAAKEFSLDALDLSNGGKSFPLALEGDGSLRVAVDGTIKAKVGWNLATMQPILDPASFRVSLTPSVTTSDPQGVVLSASVGGVAGISLGSHDADKREATITLANKAGGKASFSYNAADGLDADVVFAADLPLYVTGIAAGKLGALAATASVFLDAPAGSPLPTAPSFTFAPAYVGTPDYPTIESIISATVADINVWIDGLGGFVDGLVDRLATDLIAKIPFLRGRDLDGLEFFTKLRQLKDGLTTDTPKHFVDSLAAKVETLFGGGVALAVATGGGAAIPQALKGSEEWATLLPGVSDSLRINLTVSHDQTQMLSGGDLDLGISALGLKVRGDNAIEFTTSFEAAVALGYGRTTGFFIDTAGIPAPAGAAAAAAPEITVGLGLGFKDGAAVDLALGPLFFSATDKHAGPELSATLEVDLAAAGGQIGLSGIPTLLADATVSGSVVAGLEAQLSAKVFGDSSPGLSANIGLGFAAGGVAGRPITIGGAGGQKLADLDLAGSFYFTGITDVGLDLRGLLQGPVSDMLRTINDAVEPVRPILDLLTAEVPLISDLSKKLGQGAVTFLDVIDRIGTGADSARDFTATLLGVGDALDVLESLGSASTWNLGSLTVAGSAAGLLGDTPVTKGSFTATPASDNDDSPLSPLAALGFTFPIFTDTSNQLFSVLFGGDATLITFDLPTLGASFGFEQSFPIFPPLFAKVFGSVGFAADLGVGFDTRGVRQALGGSQFNAAKILNGAYFNDHVSGGDDAAELTLTATIGAGAELNVAIAKAGVDGGLRGTLGANLKDGDRDGRVHFDEFLRNFRNGAECVFDFEGSLDVFLGAFLKLGFDTPFGFVTLFKDRFDLLDITLLDWQSNTCPPPEPVLAEVYDKAGTAIDGSPDAGWNHDGIGNAAANVRALVLNVGPRAGMLMPGNEDGPEEFTISAKRDDAGTVVPHWIVVSADDTTQEFDTTTFDWICFDAGIGNDVITIGPDVNVKVWGFGGAGNDQLTGGKAANTLYGDGSAEAPSDGVDKLVGRMSDDHLVGGGQGDFLFGFGGVDTIDGGTGDDHLYGEDEVGDMAEFRIKNPGFEEGTPGDDTIDGGDGDDTIVAGADNDTVNGGAGGDSISGGDGNDTLNGDAGADRIDGDAGNDIIFGGDDVDLLQGGLGFNEIHGGAGNDILFAHSEVLGLTGAVTVVGGWSSRLFGDDGTDQLTGTAGADLVDGGFDADKIVSGTGNDLLLGGPGSDWIVASGGNARIYGGHGDDVIDGGDGDNWIEGGPDDDSIFGRLGTDMIYGGTTNTTIGGRGGDGKLRVTTIRGKAVTFGGDASSGFELYQQVLATGRNLQAAIHGGFSATPADDGSCAAEVTYHPEVYPDTPNAIKVSIYEDLDGDGSRDPGEPDAAAADWPVQIVDATTGTPLTEVEFQSGATFALPSDGVADGTYRVVVGTTFTPGWVPSVANDAATAVLEVTVGSGHRTAMAAFGFYRPGSLSGVVRTRQGNANVATPGVQVLLDLDGSGDRTGDEPVVATGADGSYSFTGLVPGTYGIVVLDAPPSSHPAPEAYTNLALVSGGDAASHDFLLTPSTAPVVSQVLIGEAEYQATITAWTPVPGGGAQLTPLVPDSAFTRLAVVVSAAVPLASPAAVAGGTLLTLVPAGNAWVPGAAVPISFRGTYDGSRAEYQVNNNQGLAPGRYRFTMSDGSITTAAGAKLDGDWTTGGRYPSGDGQAGGNFVFEFVVGAAAAGASRGLPGSIATFGAAGQAAAATIQGTTWWHNKWDGIAGQTATEPGVADQLILLQDANGTVQQVVTTGQLDVNGDGHVDATEAGGFRFTNLEPGTYTIQQMTTGAWVQATPGGASTPDLLYAMAWVPGTPQLPVETSGLYTIDADAQTAVKLREFSEFEVRDVAAADADTLYIVGTSKQQATLGSDRLWRFRFSTGLVEDLGATPGVTPLVAFDAYDGRTLIGASLDSTYTYDVGSGVWEDLGELRDAGGNQYWPVGDLAVAGPGAVYVVGVAPKPGDIGTAIASQKLLRLDPRRRVVNTTVITSLATITEPIVGLETDPAGGLVALTNSEKLYAIETSIGGVATWLGNKTVANLPNMTHGGLTRAPFGVIPDPGRRDFTITVSSGQTVTIGFGDVPEAERIPDGDDFIDGGCGDTPDELHGDDGDDLPFNVVSVGGHDRIRGRGGNDVIAGGLLGDTLFGDEGADTVTGGLTEVNRIEGGDGGDIMLAGGASNDVILGGAGADTLIGGGGGDLLLGGADDDDLAGGDGDDTLVGGGGRDDVRGDGGSDVLVVVDVSIGGAYAETPFSTGRGLYDGGTGSDTLVVNADYATVTLTGASLALTGAASTDIVASIEGAILTGGGSANVIDASGFTGGTTIRGQGSGDTLRGGSASDRIYGGDGADTISGNGDNDFLFGEGDGDTIDGGAGADRIDGGAGYNLLRGGADNDTYVFAGVVDAVVVEAAGGGTDTLDLTACTGNLTMTIGDASTGTSIYGYSPSVSLRYYDNQIERVTLGSGDDSVYLAPGVTTVARIDAGGGSDTLSYAGYGWSTSPWAVGVTVDLAAGTATGFTAGVASFENASGGAGNDTLAGTDGPNTIDGGAGNDSLDGRDGNDTLRGNTGNDSLDGGSGDDSLWGWSGTNTLTGGVGNDLYGVFEAGQTDTVVEAVGQGTDTIDCSWVYGTAITVNIAATIVATFGPSRVTAATPGAIDRIVGGSQADRFVLAQGSAFAGALDGGGIAGYADDDKNTLDYSGWAIPVTVNYTGSLDASFVGTATGTSGVRSLSHVIGGSAGDTLIAGEGTPAWFEGRGGNDTLTSRVQYDRLEGGDDDDTLSAGGGSDWLDGGAGADHLDGGADGDWLYGRAGDDELRGGGGDDTLFGGWGSDRLVGGTGNDYYVFEDLFGNDTIVEDPSAGTDSLNFGAVTLPLEVGLGSVNVTGPGESVTYAGNSIEEVVGGTADDTFVMTAPTVVFNGWLDGGGGTNTLRYDDATPAITAAVAAGQKPNVFGAFSFASVVAVPPASMIALSVPAGTTTTDAVTRTGISQIVKQGAGTLVLDRTNSHSGGTLVEAGEVIVKSVSALGIGGLEVAAGAKATFDVGQNAIKLGFIKFDGLVNLGEATMTVASGLTSASLVAALVAGRGDGSWNGSHGIASSAAAAQTAAGVPRTVGWTDNGDGSFTIGYTAPGDANLDKRVDILDAANFIASGKFDTGQAATWAEGNFNYDLVVDILDVADFFNGSTVASLPLAATNAATPTTDTTTTLSMGDLVFAALAQNEQSRTTTRKKAFAVL